MEPMPWELVAWGGDANNSVVNEFCQTHDIPNLFICDTSVFVTGSGLNPTLTAMAISSRAVAYISDASQRGDI
jgi:choline dehydrogenase-like flavoprotein